MSEYNFWRTVKKLHALQGKSPPLFDPFDGAEPIQLGRGHCLHFVGFRGDEYVRACRIFGRPDFIHRHNDQRLLRGGEMADGDMVIYANGYEAKPTAYSFDDSAVF